MKKSDFRECIKIGDHVLVVGETRVIVKDYSNTMISGLFNGIRLIPDENGYGDIYAMDIGLYWVPIDNIKGLTVCDNRGCKTAYGDMLEGQT